ncbi:MAG: potassium-transporting ATPase potassium-binding subunit [Solirubrobacteraceae bacterium]|jgi:K+-transporting ATPase ATPase A chain|nr:potassium-transporting ATPase potassium-binding subunit [Solirubrobacteraceae bacterium]
MLQGFLQIAIFCALIVAITPVLGGYLARVFGDERTFLDPVVGPLERATYRVLRIDPGRGQDWKAYARSVIAFSLLGWLVLFAILRTQTLHPFNPGNFHSGTWDLSFNTASSFVTNTNWQYYAGETTLSYFSQMAGLAVQNFLSAAVGLVVAIALIRGIVARRTERTPVLGNFWHDLVRACFHVLLPISIVGAILLVSQGTLQTLGGAVAGLARGPVASQEAIKELGTNGGGFFNVNSAFPFENPTGLSNLLELLLILCIPAALTSTYGRLVGSRRQGWAIFATMAALFIASVAVVYVAEMHGTPAQHAAGVHAAAVQGSTGGNMEGKEQRFGIANSALWTAVTTVTSCGAVNAAFESLTGIGGLVPMVNLSYGESVFGGVGTGLYTMLLYVLLAVFIGGLMVGRTPEFLGKKVEAREIKLVSLGVLVTPLAVLLASGLALATKYGRPSIFASGPQGFSESLYAYMSQANNNGSALAGYTGYYQPNPGNLGAHGITFADVLGGVTMLGARFMPILLVLAVAGALAGKRVAPAGLGTLRTDTPTFVVLLAGTVVLIGALTFFPALLLGPVVQGMTNRLF